MTETNGQTDNAKVMADFLRHYRDTRFAELLVVVLGLACETHPEVVRAALGKCFELVYWEEKARQVQAECVRMTDAAEKARIALDQLRAEYGRLKAEVESIKFQPARK